LRERLTPALTLEFWVFVCRGKWAITGDDPVFGGTGGRDTGGRVVLGSGTGV